MSPRSNSTTYYFVHSDGGYFAICWPDFGWDLPLEQLAAEVGAVLVKSSSPVPDFTLASCWGEGKDG